MVRVIYEDAQLIVVHKPAGIPVQTSVLTRKDMVSILKNYRAKNHEEPYIGVVHRLDQPVEGVLVFAKTKEASAKLSSQFQEGCTDKYYRAVVKNKTGERLLEGVKYTLTDYLQKDGRTNLSKVVPAGTKGAKKAILHYSVLRAKGDLAEISVHLETGRHHQIRVQMANARLPLVFDGKYGPDNEMKTGGETALCAVEISFVHPKTGKRVKFLTEPENPVFYSCIG